MQVLVTGGTGFIGSHLVDALCTRGEKVRVLVRPESDLWRLKGKDAELVRGDLRDPESLGAAVQGVEVVYHLASVIRPPGGGDSTYQDINVTGTENLLAACRSRKVARFLLSSSTGVMGHIESPPADEGAPYHPENVYARSKYEQEKLAIRMGKEGVPAVTVVRPAWTYGPRDLRTLKLFRAISRRRFAIVGDGKTLIHTAYVGNVAEGMIIAAGSPRAVGEVYILADRSSIPLERLARAIAGHLGVSIPRMHLPVKPVWIAAWAVEKLWRVVGKDPPLFPRRVEFFTKANAYSIAKAQKHLGYEADIDLEAGLERTIAWYRENGFL